MRRKPFLLIYSARGINQPVLNVAYCKAFILNYSPDMHQFDVFNGDADGICALQQYRLAHPCSATLITGVKRDIALLQRTPAQPGDAILALDINVKSNISELHHLLDSGVRVEWFDHHLPGELPQHPGFTAHIDTDPQVCTSLLVNQVLQGRYAAWAVVAAFGDNLAGSATRLAQQLGLDTDTQKQLQELGECLNYNAYGDSIADLWFEPAVLYQRLHPFADPLDFMRADSTFATLRDGYASDMAQASATPPLHQTPTTAVYQLPDSAWSRRVSGVFGNALASAHPGRAHAVLTSKPGGGITVSVRAPLAHPYGAGQLCQQFPSGGGREGAAGINHLPESAVDQFIRTFSSTW